MVPDYKTYYSQRIQDLYEECSEMERSIGRKAMLFASALNSINNSHGPMSGTLLRHPPLFQVRAIHTFESANEHDLIFMKGDIINVTQDMFQGWYEGYIDGPQSAGTGTFPANYVVAHIPAEKSTIFQARAISSFESEDKEGLTFKKGQIINVTEDFSSWLRGYIDGSGPKREGTFPTYHVVIDYPVPDLPPARVHGIEQNQSIDTSTAIPSLTISRAEPFTTTHRLGWTSRVEANRVDKTKQSLRDSMATDVSLQPAEQLSRSPSIDIASNRDSRNTLTTFPQDWNSYGYLAHAAKDTMTEQRHKGDGELVSQMASSLLELWLR
jgi:hypothetical protein